MVDEREVEPEQAVNNFEKDFLETFKAMQKRIKILAKAADNVIDEIEKTLKELENL